MKFRHWSIPIVALVLLALLLLPACGGGTTATVIQTSTKTATATATFTATPEQQYGGTLRIIWSTGPGGGWGIPTAIWGGEGAYGDMCTENLFDTLYPSAVLVPRLGTDYTVSPDGKTVTVKLRQGVKFHDGTPFNAEAVKYNYDRYIAANRASANFLGVDVIEDYTIQMNFDVGMNMNFESVCGVQIVSPTFWEENGDTVAAYHPVGTGPFKYVSYEPNVKATFGRYDDYWGQVAYLDAIESIFISDPVTQVMAMQAGQGDVTHSRQAKTMYDLKQAGFNVLQNYMGMEAMNFNGNDPDSPFRDYRVRQAFEYAINKEAVIDTLGYGYWEAAYQFPIEGMGGYLDDVTYRSYDPDKARELLDEAGLAGGFSTTFIHAAGDFDDGLMSMQADLAEVGINVNIESVQWSQLDAMRHEGWPGVLVTGSGMIPNFNTLLWTYFRPGGIEYPSLEKPSELIDAVYAACMAIPADKELTDAAARIIYDLCIWAPIEHHGDNYAYTDQVHGLNFSSYSQWGQFDAEKVWMSD